jgi:hypothetical protein
VEIEEVRDIENVMDSKVEVINCKSDAKSSEETENDDGEDAVSEVHCKKLLSAHTKCDTKGGE